LGKKFEGEVTEVVVKEKPVYVTKYATKKATKVVSATVVSVKTLTTKYVTKIKPVTKYVSITIYTPFIITKVVGTVVSVVPAVGTSAGAGKIVKEIQPKGVKGKVHAIPV